MEYLAEPYTFEDKPLWWHKAGLTQTQTGYGKRLTSSLVVRLADGRTRRVYITCYSNAGSGWVVLDGRTQYVRDTR
jgi:hypothetical protein